MTSSDTSITSNGSSPSSLQNGPPTLSEMYLPHHQPHQYYDSLSASSSSSCQGVPRSIVPPVYSTEQVMPGYPVHMPGTTYMSDPYQTPLPVNQSEPIIQPDTSTTESCNSSQELLSDLQDTLKTEWEQDTPNLPPSLMDISSLHTTDTPVPLTVSVSVLNLRFMTLSKHFKKCVAELEQVYREQAAVLESQRYHALCTPRGLSTVSVSVYYDQQHHDLINRIQHSLQLLEQKQQLQKTSKCQRSVNKRVTATTTKPVCNSDAESKPDNQRKHNKFKPLNSVAVRILSSWYQRNKEHPYPSHKTCEVMGKASNISVEQVKKWFSNRRMREGNTKHLSQIAARRKRVRTESSDIPVTKIMKIEEGRQDCIFTGFTRV